jgi:hypothetical protein
VTNLNAEQLAAIEEPGVVFVSAGAGTGKTAVLVERFVKAVVKRNLRFPIEHLLGLGNIGFASYWVIGRQRERTNLFLKFKFFGNNVSQFVHGVFVRITEVEDVSASMCGKHRLDDACDHIRDKTETSGLGAVAIDGKRLLL